MKTTHTAQLGLRQNWKQFTLLVVINAFVGSMLGLERSVFPELAFTEFHISEAKVVLSFIIVFGVSKAFTNLFTGYLIHRFGRKNMLITGWLIALPVPFIFIFAAHWEYIVLANVLLGISQGMAWSTAVIMKMDLVGAKQRGLAMGLNEFAGYLSIALIAYLTTYISHHWGVRPYPFYLGILFVAIGLLLSMVFLKDTAQFVVQESKMDTSPRMDHVFSETSWKNRTLGAITQAGLVNNLIDGVVWGLFPILLYSKGFDLLQTGLVVSLYPLVWGVLQLITGYFGDRWKKKKMIFKGMLLQGFALFAAAFADSFPVFIFISVLLGLGTALVYPIFLAAVAEHTHPLDRAESMGVFRFWRDMGYAVGAIMTIVLTGYFSNTTTLLFIACLAALSGLFVYLRMEERKK
jgi:MFS family permease